MNPRVFISYAKEDYAAAVALASYLQRNGVDVWIDTKDLQPGDRWEIQIENALRDSDYFITCISSAPSKKIGYFQAELKKALKHAERYPSEYTFVVPVILDRCEIPHELVELQWLELYKKNSKSKLVKHLVANYRTRHDITHKEPAFFIGRHDVRISRTNTLTWPKQIFDMGRLALGETVIVAMSTFDNCLAVYRPKEFEEIRDKLLARLSGDQSAMQIARLVLGNTMEVTFATSRRTTFPASLLELADIRSGGDDAVFIGMGGRLELWSASIWKARISDQRDGLAKALTDF